VLLGREPGPQFPRDHLQRWRLAVVLGGDAGELFELVAAGAGEQGPDQAVLATEKEQQHPWAGTDRGRERAKRQVGQAMSE
jgi:hypothetical protein